MNERSDGTEVGSVLLLKVKDGGVSLKVDGHMGSTRDGVLTTNFSNSMALDI